MNHLDEIRQAVLDPYGYAKKYRQDTGGKIVGYFCSYAPEEIVWAAGALPFRIFSRRGNLHLADRHLQSYCCSLVRSVLEEALSGELGFLDGVVFPHTCDSIQRLSDIWRLNVPYGFHADVVLPVKLNTESARDYMVDVLRAFRTELERKLGVAVTDEVRSQRAARSSARRIRSFVSIAAIISRRFCVYNAKRPQNVFHGLLCLKCLAGDHSRRGQTRFV